MHLLASGKRLQVEQRESTTVVGLRLPPAGPRTHTDLHFPWPHGPWWDLASFLYLLLISMAAYAVLLAIVLASPWPSVSKNTPTHPTLTHL